MLLMMSSDEGRNGRGWCVGFGGCFANNSALASEISDEIKDSVNIIYGIFGSLLSIKAPWTQENRLDLKGIGQIGTFFVGCALVKVGGIDACSDLLGAVERLR